MKALTALLLLGLVLPLESCSKAPLTPLPPPGGLWTGAQTLSPSLVRPTPVLSRIAELNFWTGFALFRDPWVAAPASTTARDGLGPVFSARSCMACHSNAGRGDSLLNEGRAVGTVYRLIDDPELRDLYGTHLQTRATFDMNSDGQRLSGFYSGEPDPIIEVVKLDTIAGPLRRITASLGDASAPVISPRIAPAIVGLGLLEAIPESRLASLEDAVDDDNDGVSGRINWVNQDGRRRAGRFGWKAPHPTVAAQTADAFRNDIGITSALVPEGPCAVSQHQCAAQREGDGPIGEHEINAQLFDLVVAFTGSIAVPAAGEVNSTIDRGRALFQTTGCAACHTPAHQIQLNGSEQTIWPYTDLLLHDMGPLLSDGIEEGDATGAEWRTPPLWALGVAKRLNPDTGFLHDGRAATIQEAVLWHGGEAARSALRFRELNNADKDALAAFVLAL